jgi:hypothetical protein
MKDKLAREQLIKLGEACVEFTKTVSENVEATDKLIEDNYANVMLIIYSILEHLNIKLDKNDDGMYVISKKAKAKSSVKKAAVKKIAGTTKKLVLKK